MNDTIIGWTEKSWNLWSGCSKVSPGCAHCYAETLSENKRGTKAFPNGFDLYRWHKLNEPLKMREPKKIFVNSMSDLYWEQVPLSNIQRVFDVMNDLMRGYESRAGAAPVHPASRNLAGGVTRQPRSHTENLRFA